MPFIRFISRILARILFRIRIHGDDVLDTPGPVLLIPNHLSWFDWWLVGLSVGEDWRFVTSSTRADNHWMFRFMMVNRYTFPVDHASPFAVKDMATFLQGGGRLILFAEGRISETGCLMKLFEGTGFLLHKTGAKVITCHLRNAMRLPWSRQPGWKQCFPKLSVHFSDVLQPPVEQLSGTADVRGALTQWLRERMIEQHFQVEMDHGHGDVLTEIASKARQRPCKVVLEDVTGQLLKHRTVMVGAEVLGEAFRRQLDGKQMRVGVLLPNVNGTAISLLALWRIGKIPAVLNYSTGVPIMQTCAELAGLKQVITSRLFLAKAKLDVASMEAAGIEFIYLEDIRKNISGLAKLGVFLKHRLALGRARFNIPTEQTAVILFTSGSEGVPKGVELTHRNILANLRQLYAIVDLVDDDSMFNCLPMFHSFGLIVGTLLPLCRGIRSYLFPSPLQFRQIPTAVYNSNATLFLSTNTFLNGYARKAHPYDFRNVRYLLAGAEKVQQATSDTWARKFGIRINEAYGVTECAPAICANTKADNRFGSVGRLLPGIEWKLEPVDGVTEGGRLFVRGPNIMKGYLNADANEAFQALGGWYDTGDIIHVDSDGYFWVKGRAKRFAKISGEMVSLTAVEDALAGAFPQHGEECEVAVVALPDTEKGEKLVAVTNKSELSLAEVRVAIAAAGMTNLCAPRDLRVMDELPKLGTGKLNHREVLQHVEPCLA
jgi:acyl-[acyl-carrier-protein]-phospholipid O-acyltransferase/long-chain-fatty-acid--[acyl-carrier-protein] ligase